MEIGLHDIGASPLKRLDCGCLLYDQGFFLPELRKLLERRLTETDPNKIDPTDHGHYVNQNAMRVVVHSA